MGCGFQFARISKQRRYFLHVVENASGRAAAVWELVGLSEETEPSDDVDR
jgi:hypothetical protein